MIPVNIKQEISFAILVLCSGKGRKDALEGCLMALCVMAKDSDLMAEDVAELVVEQYKSLSVVV